MTILSLFIHRHVISNLYFFNIDRFIQQQTSNLSNSISLS